MKKVYIFMGLPASGKGAQTKLLIDYLKKDLTFVLNFGDNFRAMKELNTPISNKVIEEMNKGNLLPSCFPAHIFTNNFLHDYKSEPNIIFDGSSRRLKEAQLLLQFLTFIECDSLNVIYLDTLEENILKRIKDRGRKDDDAESFKKRLNEYYTDGGTANSVEFYKGCKDINFVSVDGNNTIEEVHKEVLEKLKL